MQLPKYIPSLAEWIEAAGFRSRAGGPSVDIVAGTSLFAAGLLVGAGLGLLLAPSSGESLRRDLGARVADLRDRLEAALPIERGMRDGANEEEAVATEREMRA